MIRIQQRNLANIIIFNGARTFSSSNLNVQHSSNNATQESKVQQLLDADTKCNNPVPVFKKALLYSQKVAVKDKNGEKKYSELLSGSYKLSKQINSVCGEKRKSLFCF